MDRQGALSGARSLLLLLLLAACSGGHSSVAAVPQTAAAPAARQSSTATLSLVLELPATTGSSNRRFPKYVSASAKARD